MKMCNREVRTIGRITNQASILTTINKARNDVGFLKQIVLRLAEYEDYYDLFKEQQRLISKHVFHKMYPASCTEKIQVFESREEWLNFVKAKSAIDGFLDGGMMFYDENE